MQWVLFIYFIFFKTTIFWNNNAHVFLMPSYPAKHSEKYTNESQCRRQMTETELSCKSNFVFHTMQMVGGKNLQAE